MKFVKFALVGAIAIAALACGGGTPTSAPTATPADGSAPVVTPTAPTGTVAPTGSVAPAGSACELITQDEANLVFGGTVTIAAQDDGSCEITPPDSVLPVVIRYGDGETIDAAKLIVEDGVDVTIGGFRAFYGEIMGGILYIEKDGQTLVLQSPLSTEVKDQMIALATAAIARFP